MKFADALSSEGDSHKAVEAACQGIESSFEGDAPDLGFLFISSQHADEGEVIAEEVQRRLGLGHLIGCTGESLIGAGREVEGGPCLVLWAASLPGVKIQPIRIECEQTPDGFCFPTHPSEAFAEVGANPGFILLGDPFTMPADIYLRRFHEDWPGLPVMGGMASGGSAPGENLVLLDGEVHRDGAVGILVSGDMNLRMVVSQGCRPVGNPYVVTDCDRNAILKLGGKSALQGVQEVFTHLSQEDRQLFQRAPHVGVVMNETQASFGPGDFLIRNIVGIDQQHEAVLVSDYLRRGQTIQFHVRDGQAASDDFAVLLEQERRHYSNGGPAGGLIFSCNGRGTRLFERPDHDVSAVRDSLGSIPVSGFFAQGEIGPVGERSHLHGFTACVALFSNAD